MQRLQREKLLLATNKGILSVELLDKNESLGTEYGCYQESAVLEKIQTFFLLQEFIKQAATCCFPTWKE